MTDQPNPYATPEYWADRAKGERPTGADDLHLCPPCDRGDHGDCYELSGKGLDVCECPRHPRPTEANDLAARLAHMALIGASSEVGDGYLTDEEVIDLRAAAARLRELDELRAERDRLRIERDALLELLGQNADEGWRER